MEDERTERTTSLETSDVLAPQYCGGGEKGEKNGLVSQPIEGLLVDASVATSASLFLVVLVVGLLSARSSALTMGALVELSDEALLVFSGDGVDDGLGGKGLGEELLGLCGEAGGELDVKLDDQQSSVVRVALDRHALVGDDLHRFRLGDLSGLVLDDEGAVVEGGKEELETSEGLEEGDLLLHHKVVLVSLNNGRGVSLLLQNDNNVSRGDARELVSLLVKHNALTLTGSLLDVDFEDLGISNDLLSVALGALVLVINHLALSVAVAASLLHLVDSKADLTASNLDTLTTAANTLFGTSSVLLATTTRASDAEDLLVDLDFAGGTVVHLLEGDSELVLEILALGGTTGSLATTAAAVEEIKDIKDASTTASGVATGLESLLAVFVIDLTLLRIREDVVGLHDVLELLLGVGVIGVLVRVQPDGQFAERLLDVLARRASVNAEHFVVILSHFFLLLLLLLFFSCCLVI